MSVAAALPADLHNKSADTILTFIVPAANGCNLRCPFCFIGQRREATDEIVLTAQDYADFIMGVAEQETIAAICVQGHEPLLPESFSYTQAILQAGHKLNIPTSIITNGTFLFNHIDALEKLAPTKICVSLDASTAAAHDRQRQTDGAFHATVKGLKAAAKSEQLRDVLTVTSVLIPKKSHQLIGMPRYLRSLNITNWIINALIKVGKDKVGGPVGDQKTILRELVMLKNEADRHNIHLLVDDEFSGLKLTEDENDQSIVDLNHARVQRLMNPSGVFRLLPNGQCSMGLELLREMTIGTPRWSPRTISSGNFISSIRSRNNSITADLKSAV